MFKACAGCTSNSCNAENILFQAQHVAASCSITSCCISYLSKSLLYAKNNIRLPRAKDGSNLVRNSQSMLSGGSACSNLAKAPKTRLPCLVSRRWGSTASDLTSASSTAEYSYDVICCNTCNTCNIFPGQAQHSNVSSPKLDG